MVKNVISGAKLSDLDSNLLFLTVTLACLFNFPVFQFHRLQNQGL